MNIYTATIVVYFTIRSTYGRFNLFFPSTHLIYYNVIVIVTTHRNLYYRPRCRDQRSRLNTHNLHGPVQQSECYLFSFPYVRH